MNRPSSTSSHQQTFRICPSVGEPLQFDGEFLFAVVVGGDDPLWICPKRRMQMDIYRAVDGDHLAVVTYLAHGINTPLTLKQTILGGRAHTNGSEAACSLEDFLHILWNEPNPFRFTDLPSDLMSYLTAADDQERNITHVWQLWSALKVIATADVKFRSGTE